MMSASVKRRREKEEERLNLGSFICIKVRQLRDGRVLLWERRRRQEKKKRKTGWRQVMIKSEGRAQQLRGQGKEK